jgi:hypothetical protein
MRASTVNDAHLFIAFVNPEYGRSVFIENMPVLVESEGF